MTQTILNRRQFFALSAQAASKSLIVLSVPAILAACDRAGNARLQGSEMQTLAAAEANEFAAIAARIMPSDETPGANEAGVIYFMDTVLADDRDEELTLIRQGLSELQETVQARFGSNSFSDLDDSQQDSLLGEIESTPFFGTLRFLTIAGMFSLPEYGGNQDRIGYRIIGFDDQHAWAPPFGFYDAQQNGGRQ